MALDRTPQKKAGLLPGQYPGGASNLPNDHGGLAMTVKIARGHVVVHFGDRPCSWFAMTSAEAQALSDLIGALAKQLHDIEEPPKPKVHPRDI